MGKNLGEEGMWNFLWKRFIGGKDPSKMDPKEREAAAKAFERQLSKFFGIDDLTRFHING
jgi:hypothetical protein